jgi:hypothetical protein
MGSVYCSKRSAEFVNTSQLSKAHLLERRLYGVSATGNFYEMAL